MRFINIAPAPPTVPVKEPETGFFDLPGEIRNQIYNIALENVKIHVLPKNVEDDRRVQHPLTRVCKQIRGEVLPIIWS